MTRRWLLKLSLLVLTIPRPAVAGYGPGEAAGGAQAARSAQRSPAHADFKVLVWYRRDDSLGTFKYQIYDVRKGEYTPAVDAWIKDIQARFPAYIVMIRDVDLKREKGETELLKVGSVIQRELTVAAALSGVVLGQPLSISPGPTHAGASRPLREMQVPGSNALGSAGIPMGPYPPTFPIPIPFPRLPR
jgi:hypothetical protein